MHMGHFSIDMEVTSYADIMPYIFAIARRNIFCMAFLGVKVLVWGFHHFGSSNILCICNPVV
jgi:hypothetical protein